MSPSEIWRSLSNLVEVREWDPAFRIAGSLIKALQEQQCSSGVYVIGWQKYKYHAPREFMDRMDLLRALIMEIRAREKESKSKSDKIRTGVLTPCTMPWADPNL